MTSLDELDLFSPPLDEGRIVRTPRKHRHVWIGITGALLFNGTPLDDIRTVWKCSRCGRLRDETRARRGKSARRLGGDQERRIERVYGPVKRGEYGDAVDHVGAVWRWQSKATRSLPPRWLAAIDVPQPRDVLPVSIERAHAGMAGLFDPRRSVVIRSFIRNGGLAAGRTRDWLFVGYLDAEAELGAPRRLPPAPWWVIPGDWWLDHFGRDE
jgi:hypothetical protein